jgi:class 3 adenylate cyclase/tetratricopeptide (TPR) repeat protein
MGAPCPSCGREAGAGQFCEGCGATLARLCSSCGGAVSPDASYCSSCGERLDGGETGPADGGRRQLAVLFCDVVDSTPLSRRIDVEEYGQLMLDVQGLVSAAITALGGTVGSFAGDGGVAWFGWPVAHEEDTARAVHAGLAILARLEDLNATVERLHGLRLAMRVSVHVGPVLVRTDRSDVAFGETVNRAARLEGFAEPGTLVISEAAHRLVGGRFRTEFLGLAELKGVDEPVGVHRVFGARAADEPPPLVAFDAPLVGRELELEQLLGAWSATRRGVGRTVVISGEPGVGKSRLLATVKESLGAQPHRWLELRCSPLLANTAFHPVSDMVRRGWDIPPSADPEEQKRAIGNALPADQADAVALIAGLLGLRDEGLPAPEKFRHDLMEAVAQWLAALARAGPIVLAGEDLHWSDPSTLELVGILQERLAAAPVLIILTRRPEASLGLVPSEEVVLDRLGHENTKTLARRLAAGRGLAPEVAERVAERSDGVPLFVEELVAAAAVDDDDGTGLPSTLQSSLLARLDRLGWARDIAQIASVLGRSFPEQLLAAAANVPPHRLLDAVRRLTAAGIFESHAVGDGWRYEFRHALIRDAAYESLLKRRRVELHRHVADVLEHELPELGTRNPELLAHHLAQGQEPLRAAQCFEQAGRRAAGSAALAEAAAHYRRGIELLSDLAPSPERDHQELWLNILLGNALMGLEGIGAEILRPVWERAIDLGEQVGDPEELTAALNGLAVEEADNADIEAATVLAQRQLEIADRTGSRIARLRGHGTMGLALFYGGRGHDALDHLQASLACYQPGDFQLVTFGVGHDQAIFAHAISSWALWWIGRPDAALAEIRDAVAEAERLGSFLSLAMARHFLALAHQLRRERKAALHQAQLNAAFAHELGFRLWEGIALLTAGTERTHLGDAEGLRDVERGLGLLSQAGSRSGTTSGLGTLAEAHHAAGNTDAALATVDTALRLSRELGQPYWDAELMRLKAEFVLALDPAATGSAEALLRAALADATGRGAGGLALRSSIALGRQLAERDPGESRSLVAAALESIEGGDDTADVLAARDLIDSLPMAHLEAKELR